MWVAGGTVFQYLRINANSDGESVCYCVVILYFTTQLLFIIPLYFNCFVFYLSCRLLLSPCALSFIISSDDNILFLTFLLNP